MAKDLPEYRKQNSIQPQANPINYSGALAETNTDLNLIGNLGVQVAKHASMEQSRLKALEDAKTPGRTLLPAFTPSDQTYIDTYKAQEYAIALTNGSKELSRLGFESLKRPNAESLAAYDEESQLIIDQLASQVTPETSQRIKDTLGVDALNQRFKIEAEIYKRDERFLSENFQAAYEQTLKSISDAMALGDTKTADIILQTTNAIIDDPAITYNLSESSRIKLKNVLVQTKENAQYRDEIIEAIKNKTVAKKLEELTHEPFTSKNLRKAEVYLDTYKQQLALTAAHDELIIDAMRTKMANGTLSPSEVITAKDQVDPSRFADFEVQYTKWLQDKVNDGNIYDYFTTNKKNAMALSSLTPGQMDKAFGQYVKDEASKRGIEPSLGLEAQLAAGIDAPIPSVNKKINNGINSLNPQVAAAASSIYGALSTVNPNAVSGVTNDAGQKAETWNRLLQAGATPEEAYKDIHKMYDEVTPSQLKEREEMWPRLLANKKINTIDKQKKEIASSLGFNESIMPEGMALEFMELLRSKYMGSGSYDDAWTNTSKQMAQIYSQTYFNGFEQIMRNAPDKFLPSDEVKQMKLNRAEQLFSDIDADFKNPQNMKSLYSYRLTKQTIGSVPGSIGLGLGGLTAALGRKGESKLLLERIDNEGKITKGILVVMPDKYTDYPPQGVLLSYGMYFKADGQSQFQPIYDAKENYSNARFDVTIADVEAYQQRIKSEDEKYAQQLDEHVRKLQAQQAKILEMRLEAGEDLYYEG